MRGGLAVVSGWVIAGCVLAGAPGQQDDPTWAVLVDTSRFWFNYRHVAGSLGVYQSLKAGGLSDQHVRKAKFRTCRHILNVSICPR